MLVCVQGRRLGFNKPYKVLGPKSCDSTQLKSLQDGTASTTMGPLFIEIGDLFHAEAA